jgi:ATP-binding cassette subfamily F protein 3
MKECGAQMNDLELRGLLGCFLFSGDDADKKIKVLSGGEKARVALAKTIISKANFLMLDEPTNHLDMHSCDLLIEALKKYEGSLILVSHDRYFISKTANKIWEIVDQEVKEFKGGYDEWVEWKERMAKQAAESSKQSSGSNKQSGNKQADGKQSKPAETPKPVAKQQATAQPSAPINKDAKKELQRLQKQFQQLEEQIAKLTQQKNETEASLASPAVYSDKTKFVEAENAYKKISADLQKQEKEYEQLFEKIMDLEKRQ